MAELRIHRDLTERGESAIVGALLTLGSPFIILPHLTLPGRSWPEAADDLDVVVLGPGGAALLAYHHWQGVVEAAPASLSWRLQFPGGGTEDRPDPVAILQEKARALENYLTVQGLAPPRLQIGLVFPERTQLKGDIPVFVTDTLRLASWLKLELSGGEDPDWPRRAADQLRPPSPIRMINQYQITSILKRHANRTTYLAFDTIRQRQVILQELSYDPYQQPEQLDRVRQELLREAKLTMELDHPDIVRTERVIPKDDRFYIVTEWLESCRSLREQLEQTAAPPPAEALEIAISLAGALAHAHSKGIIHRDVRPENILIAPGAVKITNFGMAKKADLLTRSTFDLRKLASESPYSAPEFRLGQAGHHEVDARADVFSLGVVLYELLTGQLPGHLDEKYWEAPSQFVGDLLPGLDEVVGKALKFDPAQRFSTMAAMRERLLQVRAGLPDHPDSSRARYAKRRLVRRTRNSLIYQAEDRKFLRTVALKRVLVTAAALTPEARKQQIAAILREVAIASRLIHPGVVHIIDHFLEDDDGYIVMEWLPGQSVRELLDGHGGSLPVPLACDLLCQIGEALHFAHGLGIIHRDIKPENVSVHQGRATVLDFGIAMAPGWALGEIAESAGTARYLAPEILRGLEVDARADVFSLGVMAYEIVTGRYPYPPSVILSRYDASHLSEGIAAPSTLKLEVNSQLSAAIMRAIAPDPAERYDSMVEFLEALAVARGKSVGQGSGSAKRLLTWVVGSALAITILLVAALLALGPFLARTAKQPSTLLPSPTSSATEDPLARLVPATASAFPALAVVASPSLAPSPLASLPAPTAFLAATPTIAPTPSPTPKVSWASSPQSIGGVSLAALSIEPIAGQTRVVLRVRNDTADAIKLLGEEGMTQIADDQGTDYSSSLDYTSVAPQLREIGPGQEVEGAFIFHHGLTAEVNSLVLVFKEEGGIGRIFTLRAHRLVEKTY
ncbi:MAG: protein kinase [Cyanobacteria bacterium NC_groundwater_1444_Ag_S-0.65um_54_12]|nr:protein kinase [Cyanobacteria bacterium NC_groundwater_1444_Ag_S-0.65um_54_12]